MAAHPSAATEHTGEPQLAGYVCTHNTSNATEHADAGSSSGEWQIVATEHDDAPDILFTPASTTRSMSLHAMGFPRDNYDDPLVDVYVSAVPAHGASPPPPFARYWGASPPASAAASQGHHHLSPALEEEEDYYGPLPPPWDIPPPPQRLDAKLYFADTSTCSRAVQVHEVAPNPMTFQAAIQIPMKDKMGKAEAWRQLSERDDDLIDVTEHDPFKWWLFLSNLSNSCQIFGTGITSVQIHKRENKIGLRTEHTDSSVQWVILTPYRSGYKTQLATEFA